jgi:hypothetical protein
LAKQSSQVRNEIQGENRRVNSEHQSFMDMIMGRINNPGSGPGSGLRGEAASGFRGVLNRGPSRYDPMFMDAAKGGLVTDENRRRIRGNGVFDRFQKDGGYSDSDLADIKSESNRTMPSFFSALKNQFKNRADIQGRGGPAYTSSLSRIARDESRGASEQATKTRIGLKDAVNRGIQWGTEGVSGAESRLADLESANKRFGISGGASNEIANRGLDLDALRGILGVGESESGEQFKLYDMLLGAMGQRGSLAGAGQNRRMSYDPNVSWFDRLMGIWSQASKNAQSAGGGALY